MQIDATGITNYPLRAFQRDYWEFHSHDPRSPGTHILFGVDVRGDLDRGALEAALVELRRSHPILRTTYAERGGGVRQYVAIGDDAPLPLSTVEYSPLRVTSLGELVQDRATTPFDLARGPCWRVVLVSDPADARHHLVLFDVHHIGWDALSSPIALADLGSWYAAITSRDATRRPPAPALSNIDLARALDRYAITPAGIADREFWSSALADAPPVELPVDRPVATPAPDRRPPSLMVSARGTIPLATIERLQREAEKAQTTVFVVCLSALARLLHRMSGQCDLCIEMPVAERRYDPRLARALGPFVHCLVVRTTLAKSASVLDSVPALKHSVGLAMKHRRAPATDFASPTIRRVGINYLQAPPLGVGHIVDFGPQLRAMGFAPPVETGSQYDLFVYIRGHSVMIFGRDDLFTRDTCDRMLAEYLELLESA